ncbi:MAG: hypothetical protein HKM04_11140 [Legionellales bacterium]|nr:hypothetical protein [Legionellales bacterium]
MPSLQPLSEEALLKELYSFIEINDIDFPEYTTILQQLLKNPHSDIVNVEGSKGLTPLMYAIAKKRHYVIDALLAYVTNIDGSCEGMTPLWYAAFLGDHISFQKLLAKGASLETTNAKGEIILYTAAFNGRDKIVDLLMKTGVNPDELSLGISPLYAASKQNHLNVVTLLLDAQCDIDQPSPAEFHRTALFAATLNYNSEVLELLLSRSANINFIDENSNTALSIAYYYPEHYFETINILKNKGAKPPIGMNRIISQIKIFLQTHGKNSKIFSQFESCCLEGYCVGSTLVWGLLKLQIQQKSDLLYSDLEIISNADNLSGNISQIGYDVLAALRRIIRTMIKAHGDNRFSFKSINNNDLKKLNWADIDGYE